MEHVHEHNQKYMEIHIKCMKINENELKYAETIRNSANEIKALQKKIDECKERHEESNKLRILYFDQLTDVNELKHRPTIEQIERFRQPVQSKL